MKPLENVSIIIRSAYERTEALCKKMILGQEIDENQLFIVHEVPFSAAMRKSFKIGIRAGRKWTYCIDADVLLQPGSIPKMLKLAENEPEKVCEIQGFVMDKFFGGPRQAGNHLYRTSLLSRVIANIPEEGTDIRPERYSLGKMDEQGYPWKSVPCIVGLHDEYQSNYDIYRKAFVHGIKHLDRTELLITRWRELADRDPDFKVALAAFSDSLKYSGEAFINSEQPLYRANFEKTGFKEKEPIEDTNFSGNDIKKLIDNWEYSDLYYVYFPDRDGLDNKSSAAWQKVKRNARNQGVIKTSKLVISDLFIKAGKKLRR